MSKRYPGQVARIRVSPTDFLSVVDVVDALGMRQPGMSFSSMVSIALSSCLEGLRQNGTIPEREGFEFNEVKSTVMTPRNKKALFITDKFQSRTSDFRIAAPPRNSVQFMKTAEELLSQNGTMEDDEVETPEERAFRVAELRKLGHNIGDNGKLIKESVERREEPQSPPAVEEIVTTEMRLARRRLAELVAKQDLIEAKAPGVTWSSGDQREFDELCKVVYGA